MNSAHDLKGGWRGLRALCTLYSLLALAILVMASGCAVVFRDGLPLAANTKPDKALLGYWWLDGLSIVCSSRTNAMLDIVMIEQSGGGVRVSTFEGYSAVVGHDRYLCMRPVTDPDDHGKPISPEGWLILNYRPGWRSVSVRMIRPAAIRQLIQSGRLKGVGDGGTNLMLEVTVTASADEVARLFEELGADAVTDADKWIIVRRGR